MPLRDPFEGLWRARCGESGFATASTRQTTTSLSLMSTSGLSHIGTDRSFRMRTAVRSVAPLEQSRTFRRSQHSSVARHRLESQTEHPLNGAGDETVGP